MPHFTGMDPASPLYHKAQSKSVSKSPKMRLTLHAPPAADSIRILVSTDNHVGYMERDGVRHNDSWRSFDEVMTLAKENDVDMVLLAGDLFHENKPSRKSMYQVMQSLRANALGDKPCELQMLSDGSEHFAGSFNHVNTDDRDINVAIPVFSIHGNHDDPSGEGNFAALDILAMSGLLNYYGRTPENDNIEIKPVLMQKGKTKLALYGMSNVRDERLFRTFRDGKVKFFQPSTQHGEWFNIMSVHQNHHAYTETSYLPEQFLPSFMDLVIWGHEHECKIDPIENPEKGFHVMQPGSSVATSLVKGEAVPKQVAIVTVTGTDFDVEPIRLKSVRPFVIREIVMNTFPEMQEVAFINDNRTRISAFLEGKIYELIEEANHEWYEAQVADGGQPPDKVDRPLPLIRLRVESTPPEGGKFDLDNPQRFSNKFTSFVANATDVIQFHRKKRGVTRGSKAKADMPEDDVMARFSESIDSLKVDKLVKEFLGAQSLTILPQNSFTDAVDQFVHKDDHNAMSEFVNETLENQLAFLGTNGKSGHDGETAGQDEDEDDEDDFDDEDIQERIEQFRLNQEEAHAKGELRRAKKKGKLMPRPSTWNSDNEGHWEDNALAWIVEDKKQEGQGDVDEDEVDDDASVASAALKKTPARGRGSRGGRGGKAATGPTRKTAATTKKAPSKSAGRGKKKQVVSDDEDEDEDIIMVDDIDEEEEESQGLFVSQAKPTTSRSRAQRSESPVKKAVPKSTRGRGASTAASSSSRQTQINFSGTQTSGTARSNGAGRATASRAAAPKQVIDLSDDDISDDDAFEPPPAAQRSTRTGRR